MDLDGISKIRPDRPYLIWGLTTLSYLENQSFLLLEERSLDAAARQLSALPESFADFCEFVSRDVRGCRNLIEGAAFRSIRSRWMNAPPVARMLRSHWFWAWYETSRLIVMASRNPIDFSWCFEELGQIGLRYEAAARRDGRIIVRGPNHIFATDEVLRAAFDQFNGTVREHWREQRDFEHEGPLFTVDDLYRYALARSSHGRAVPPTGSESRRLLEKAVSGLLKFGAVATLTEISSYCALLSAEGTMKSFGMGSRMVVATRRATDTAIRRMRAASDAQLEEADDQDERLARFLWRREEAGALAWGQYFQESVSLFDSWLARNSYLNIAPHVFIDHHLSKRIWDRICRFLSGLFLSVETTIYRYCVAEPGSPLKVVGTFFEYGPSVGEPRRPRLTMGAAATDPVRRARSVSYRAADRNETQYVPTTLEEGAEQVLAVPMAGGTEAESVLAIPIRLNGSVWGIVEFVSVRAEHFGSLLRSKCEEIASRLSTGFLLANIFDTLGRLDEYWSDEFPENRGRRRELCYTLSGIFLSDALSLYVGARGMADDDEIFGIEEFGSWVSPNAKAEKGAFTKPDLATVRSFLDRDAEVEEIFEPSKDPCENPCRRTFLVRLVARGSKGWSGALAFSVPYPIVVDETWRQTTFALGQIVAGVISSISSAASWNREARRDLRHEYRRIAEQLQGVRLKLSGVARRVGSSLEPNEKRNLDLLPGDMQDLIVSLQAVSDTLLADVYDRLLHDDRRLIAVKRAQEEYLPALDDPANPRDLYHSRFINAANAEPQKHLRIIYSPGVHEKLILMHPGTLSDILGTLADNAVKYSIPRSEIIMTFLNGAQGSLLMRISNLAPALEDDEVDEIFEDGFRGRAAREMMPERGSGRGLRFARGAMELWNGGLDYDFDSPTTQVKASDKRPIVWHRFTLIFPANLLVDK